MKTLVGFKYRFSDNMYGVLILNIVLIAVMTLSSVSCVFNDKMNSSFNGAYEVAASIMMFVLGIVTIREDLRIANQCGRGRKTAFATNLLTLVAASAVLAVLCQIITLIFSAAMRNYENLSVMSIMSMSYLGDFEQVYTLSFGEHIISIIFNFAVFVAVSTAGVFCSALFYKIPSKLTAIVGVVFGVFLGIGLPALFGAIALLANVYEGFGNALMAFLTLTLSGPVRFTISAIVFAAIVSGVNFLLVRKVAVKAVGEKG